MNRPQQTQKIRPNQWQRQWSKKYLGKHGVFSRKWSGRKHPNWGFRTNRRGG